MASYEVELKFRVESVGAVQEQLAALSATPGKPTLQADRYFAHPGRDFVASDEALRVRSSGPLNLLTYKGPVIDALTRMRREIEIAFDDGAGPLAQMTELLEALGFAAVRTVRKRRTPFQLCWEGRPVEVVLDDVEELGRFVEVETIADDADKEHARDSILRLAARLALRQSEERSYLTLLLGSNGQTGR